MLLSAHHSSLRYIGFFICQFSLLLYIGKILFSYIRKHLPIEPKPSGNAPQAPGAHNTQQATPYAYNTQQYLQTPGVYNTQQATSYVNNAPQQPTTPVESTSDKSLATVARLALGILYAFYVCFSFFLCCLLISWIF